MARKGKVTHFEIPVEKMERARKFYADSFGWNVMDMPGQSPDMPYVMAIGAETDERGMVTEKGAINGGIIKRAAPLQASNHHRGRRGHGRRPGQDQEERR